MRPPAFSVCVCVCTARYFYMRIYKKYLDVKTVNMCAEKRKIEEKRNEDNKM